MLLKSIHSSEMDDIGECALVHLGPAGGVLSVGGRTQGAQLRK